VNTTTVREFARQHLGWIAAFAVVAFPLLLLERSMFNVLPATGGDTGSHYWPLHVLREHAWDLGTIRIWSPGNLGGEPLLVHYFPLPFLIMLVLSIFVPTGLAFNLGTILPLMALPAAVWWGVRRLTLSTSAATLSAACVLPFMFNEGYSMWGGNALSLLAGQFAHLYAVVWLMIGVGALADDLRYVRWPWRSALAFAGVCLSHAYIMLCLPGIFICLLFLNGQAITRDRVIVWLTSGVLALAMSVWFLYPMIDNAKWTTPFAFNWRFENFIDEVIPDKFWPVLGLGCAGLIAAVARPWRGITLLSDAREIWRSVGIWTICALICVGYFFLFPVMGLVDVRAVPQAQLFICLACAAFGTALLPSRGAPHNTVVAVLAVAIAAWTWRGIEKFPAWVNWNYGGWQSKELFPALSKLSATLRADFSAPRVVFEHHDENNKAGTTRVFEMLPFFASRSTNESVYMQSTILAPVMFHLQAQVSLKPSCPFPNYSCTNYEIVGGEGRFDLLAVGDLILLSSAIVDQAKRAPFLRQRETYGPWLHFSMLRPPSYVGHFRRMPTLIGREDFRARFWTWYRNYPNVLPDSEAAPAFLAAPGPRSFDLSEDSWISGPECEAHAEIDFNRIRIRTSCPGRALYVKVAYHSNWRSQSGEELFPVSPGFIGLVPNAEVTELRFASPVSWRAADLFSGASLLLLTLGGSLWRRMRKPKWSRT